jgi:hypothetical protein
MPVVFACACACFSEAPGSATASGSATATGSTTGSEPDTSVGETKTTAESSTVEPSTIADTGSGSTTGLVCNDVVVENVPIQAHPVDLFVVALSGTDPSSFNAAFTSAEFVDFAEMTDMRTVVIDPMVGVAEPADACAGCSSGTCDKAVRLEIPDGTSPFPTLFDFETYSCALHPMEGEPRRRLLFLSPSAVLAAEDALVLEELINDGAWDLDMACPGCSGASPGFTQTVAAAGGFVLDLDDEDMMGLALFAAAAPPPRCGWAANDPIEPPLELADLSITIDVCRDLPCPRELEQVTGLAGCDSGDPSPDKFFILEDFLGDGISLVLPCDAMCEAVRRVYVEDFSVTHSYRCPT